MAPRLLLPAVALTCLAAEVLFGREAAHLVLLLAIPFCAVAVLESIGESVAVPGGGLHVSLEVAALALVVAGATLRAPLLAVACLVPFALRRAPRLVASYRPTRTPRRRAEARARA